VDETVDGLVSDEGGRTGGEDENDDARHVL
jgi:hypothetical protein